MQKSQTANADCFMFLLYLGLRDKDEDQTSPGTNSFIPCKFQRFSLYEVKSTRGTWKNILFENRDVKQNPSAVKSLEYRDTGLRVETLYMFPF